MLLSSPGEGGRQTPRVAEQTPGISSRNATSTPLPSPSPIQATTPLSATSGTLSSTTGTLGSTDSAPAKSAEKTDEQATHVVRFDPADGSKPTQSTMKTGTLAPLLPRENPQRPGFRFDGWFINEVVYDFSRPVTDNLILTARWTHLTCRTTSEASAPTGQPARQRNHHHKPACQSKRHQIQPS